MSLIGKNKVLFVFGFYVLFLLICLFIMNLFLKVLMRNFIFKLSLSLNIMVVKFGYGLKIFTIICLDVVDVL